MRTQRPFSRFYVASGLLAVLLLVLPGCDTGGSNETIVLNDPVTPTEASFEFRYNEDDFSDGIISVTSENSDQLTAIIEEYGFRRSDVVSARVEAVRMERLSTASTAAKQTAKVFPYLSSVEVYMGTTANAPLIGERQPVPTDAVIELDLGPNRDVTEQVKSGASRALLQLAIDDPTQVPGSDGIEVEVVFRIEVQE